MGDVAVTVAKHVRLLFASALTYVVTALLALAFGYYFVIFLDFFLQQSVQLGSAGAPAADVNQMLIRPLLQNLALLLLFALPAFTLPPADEERPDGIDWSTSSGTVVVVLGRFAAAVVSFAMLLAITLVPILLLFRHGNPEWKPIASAYLGLLLLGGALLAIGLIVSALTRNRTVAGVVTLSVYLLLWFAHEPPISESVRLPGWLSVTDGLDDFAKGVVDLGNVVHFLNLTALALCLCTFIELRKRSASAFADIARDQRVVLTSVFVVGAGLVLLTIAGPRGRWDLTDNHQYSLSEQTRRVLATLKSPLRIQVFALDSDFRRYQDAVGEYARASRQVSADYIDPDKFPALAAQHSIDQYGTIVLSYGGRDERVTSEQEQDITNAIIKVLSPRARMVAGSSRTARHAGVQHAS